MLIISVRDELQPVHPGEHLFTRPLGAKLRERIIDKIMSYAEEVIALDFTGIKIMDVSGADELVWKLTSRITTGELGERFMILQNLDTLHRENISATFKLNVKKLAVLEQAGDKLSLIGPLKPMLLEVLAKVYNDGLKTARTLADETEMEINLAGTKLLELHKMRLVQRREEVLPEGGRQYVYQPIVNLPFSM